MENQRITQTWLRVNQSLGIKKTFPRGTTMRLVNCLPSRSIKSLGKRLAPQLILGASSIILNSIKRYTIKHLVSIISSRFISFTVHPRLKRFLTKYLLLPQRYIYSLSIQNKMLIKAPDGKNLNNIKTLPSNIVFRPQVSPLVSIIICNYNKVSYTLNCLYSISKLTDQTPYEVIVIDDASDEKATPILCQIKSLKYFRNTSNLGFVHSANLGSSKAIGDYLIFLNNDTIVLNTWLDNLIKYLRNNPSVGLAGSKLIYPNFTLQEAGGYVFNDGSAMNFGKGDYPNRSQYNYSKQVDYCSGASLAISRSIFLSVGCFSRQYAPCYYEDTDLAFKVRNAGFEVHYVHNSQLIHFEGISCGKNIKSGPKKYQEINKAKFQQQWIDILHSQPSPPTKAMDQWSTFHINKKNILVIDQCLTPDKDSGSYRMWNILQILKKQFNVSFWPYHNHPNKTCNGQLKESGIEVLDKSLLRSLLRLKANKSLYDYAIICRPHILENRLDLIKTICPNTKIIYDTVDLHFLRIQRQAELCSDPSEKTRLQSSSRRCLNTEINGIKQANQTWVVSEAEMEIINKHVPHASIHVIPNIHPLPDIRRKLFHNTKDLLFIGSFIHSPNADSIKYLIKEIWPLITKEIPEARLIVIGAYAPQEIMDLCTEKIVIRGYVPDLEHDLISARVFVAPLRYGAGMKGKIGQALSYGIPTVTTTIGAEGFGFTGDELIVEDDPERFAHAVASLYRNETQWNAYHRKGRSFMRKFTPHEANKLINKALHELVD